MKTPYNPDNKIRLPLEHYMKKFGQADPAEISRRTGVPFENGFELSVLGRTKHVSWPDFQDEGWTDKDRILFLRYLLEGTQVPARGNFVTYRDLPWGEVYDRNFSGRCLIGMARYFGARPEQFRAACESFGGLPVKSSGIAYELQFMPGLFLRFFLWEGDEELPHSAQILFSDNFEEAFVAEDRVVVCEYVLALLKNAVSGL